MSNLRVLEWGICWEYNLGFLGNVPASVRYLTAKYNDFNTGMICAMLQTQLSQNWVNIRVVTDIEIDIERIK
jgi:hypothetical protein